MPKPHKHRYNVRTEWRTREYKGDVVTGIQLRSFGQSVWLRADELRRIALELDRLADEHDSASTGQIAQSRPNRKETR